MTKESLIEMGLTEEQAAKVMDGLNGDFVPKSRFNEINADLKNTRAIVAERDKQLEALKKASGDTEALKAQITELQKANAEQQKAHEAEMRTLRIDNAVDSALTAARSRNNIAARALMADFLEKAELAEDGSVKGLKEAVDKLVKGQDTAFMFDSGDSKPPKFSGAKPAEGGSDKGGSISLKDMTYDQLCEYFEANPEAAES